LNNLGFSTAMTVYKSLVMLQPQV
jgi:hypothetical protein